MKPLEKIVETLLINGTLTNHPGLFYGKMGISVFFFHYARQTGNKLFQDYAMDIVEEIQEQITITFSARYDVGLAGIGTGFEYLLQNGFLEENENDVFEDFDDRMYRAAMYEPYPNLSLQEGLTGWGRYFIYRLRGNGYKHCKLHESIIQISEKITRRITENIVAEDEQIDVYRFLCDLTSLPVYAERYGNFLKRCMDWQCICELDIQKAFPYMNNLQRLYTCQKYFNIDLTEKIKAEWKKWEEMNNNSLMDLGLLTGWAAEGLLYLILHQQDISWINLL